MPNSTTPNRFVVVKNFKNIEIMAYGEELYNEKHVIGYTGELGQNPTFYFKRDLGGGKISFGHITQHHRLKSNIGREEIIEKNSKRYEIKNDGVLYRTDTDDSKTIEENYKNKEAILKNCTLSKEKNENVTMGDSIRNTTYNDENGEKWTLIQSSVEIVDGKLHHASRNLINFVNAGSLSKRESAALTQALENPMCFEMKDSEEVMKETQRNILGEEGVKKVNREIDEMLLGNKDNLVTNTPQKRDTDQTAIGNTIPQVHEQDEDIAMLDALVAAHTPKKEVNNQKVLNGLSTPPKVQGKSSKPKKTDTRKKDNNKKETISRKLSG